MASWKPCIIARSPLVSINRMQFSSPRFCGRRAVVHTCVCVCVCVAQASENDRFVALELLKNANIAAGMVLPGCQDTGTAIIMGKRGQVHHRLGCCCCRCCCWSSLVGLLLLRVRSSWLTGWMVRCPSCLCGVYCRRGEAVVG